MSYQTVCWNCKSPRFIETMTREFCPDCGIECLYHGAGANDKYRSAMEVKYQREEVEREERFQRLYGG